MLRICSCRFLNQVFPGLNGFSCRFLLGFYIEQRMEWSGCFLKLGLRKSVLKLDISTFPETSDFYSTQPQITCFVVTECPVANSGILFAGPTGWWQDHFEVCKAGLIPSVVSRCMVLKAMARICPHHSSSILADWCLDQDRYWLFSVLTVNHIPHMNAQYNVSELVFINYYILSDHIYTCHQKV